MPEAIVTDAVEEQTQDQVVAEKDVEKQATTNTQQEKKESIISKREKMLEDVHNKYYGDLLNREAITHPREFEEQNSRIEFENDDSEENPVNAVADNKETNNQQQETKRIETDSPVYRNADGEWVTKVKVNGVEKEEPLSRILATAQKHESADQRLQEAARKQRELNELAHEIQLKNARQAQQNKQPLPSTNQDVKSKETYAKEVREAIERMYDGDVDVATEKLTKLLELRNQQPQVVNPTIDENYLINQAAAEAIRRTEAIQQQRYFNQEIERGKQWINENYPQFVKDQDLWDLANLKTMQIMNQNPNANPFDVIKTAVNDIAKVTGQTASSRETAKEKLKAPIKKQTNHSYQPPKKEEVDTSPLGVLNAMKAERAKIRNSPG